MRRRALIGVRDVKLVSCLQPSPTIHPMVFTEVIWAKAAAPACSTVWDEKPELLPNATERYAASQAVIIMATPSEWPVYSATLA